MHHLDTDAFGHLLKTRKQLLGKMLKELTLYALEVSSEEKYLGGQWARSREIATKGYHFCFTCLLYYSTKSTVVIL